MGLAEQEESKVEMDKRIREKEVEDEFVHIENRNNRGSLSGVPRNQHSVKNRPLNEINSQSPAREEQKRNSQVLLNDDRRNQMDWQR